MKYRLLIKNLLCEIKKTSTRFLSIFAICALGSAFFAGLRATCPDMQEAADRLFFETRLSDITVLCSKGISEDDLKALRALPGVELVRPELYVDAMMTLPQEPDKEWNLRLHSLPIKETEEKTGSLFSLGAAYDIEAEPEPMDELELHSGRLPQSDEEVALDSLLLERCTVALGDYAEFRSSDQTRRLRIVGFVYSAKYVGIFERGNSGIGNGRSDAFAYTSGNTINALGTRLPMLGLLKRTYTQAVVRIARDDELSAFSEEYEERVNAVMDSIEAYGDTREGTWYVEDRSANPGYADYKSNTQRIGAIADVFPVIFFVVAALVCLTTMTRMVEEQRIEMGTLKALGYSQTAITAKYFAYAMLACIAGSFLGCVIGFWLFPTVILNAYGIMYKIPDIRTPYRADVALLSILASAACTGVATLSASYAALREVPATLMRPKAPLAGKRVFLEYIGFIWRRLNFTAKVTVRNLFRYKKRFFMSIIGIAGSCALLVTGFGLHDSIFGISEKQFGDIWSMDLQAYAYEDMPQEELAALVRDCGAMQDIDSIVYCNDTMVDAKRGAQRLNNVHVMGVEDVENFAQKIDLRAGSRTAALTDEGAVVTTKLAETLSLRAGDTLQIVREGASYDVRVTDIVENYVYHYVYMTDAYFARVFEDNMEFNACLISLKSQDASDRVVERLLGDSRMYTVRTLRSIMADMDNVLSILDYVVAVLIVGSALLTFVVMLNLTNINLEERKRELATLRVLGFYDKEMYDYIFRENNALAVIGAALGLALGRYMHAFVIRTAEVDMVMFLRTANTLSFVYAFVLTIVFSLCVNLMMRRKVRAIDMVGSLKSAE